MRQVGSYAGFGQRLVAFLLDYIVISIYIVLLVALSFGIGATPWGDGFVRLFANPISAEVTAFLLLVLPVVLYFAFFETSARQGTWGKQRLGLRVTDERGERISFGKSLLRSLLKFLPWELTHLCLWNIPGWPMNVGEVPPWIVAGLSLVWVIVFAYAASLLLSKTSQTIYDRIAGTLVLGKDERSGRRSY